MKTVCLHAKDQIEAFLCHHTFLHLYSIGDLDNFFWDYTTWYALIDEERIKQLVLLYSGASLPVLLGLTEELDLMKQLVRSLIHLLPKKFYAHLSGDVATVLADEYQIKSHGLHYKMALTNSTLLDTVDTSNVKPLIMSDIIALEELYRVAYPGNWFEPRMLETSCYYGIQQDTSLVSVAGVHVYSEQYRVAALGNITTHPLFRGLGLAKAVSAKLCKDLLQQIDHIGLNVKADNTSAIAVYTRLGFEIIATYEEYELELKPIPC